MVEKAPNRIEKDAKHLTFGGMGYNSTNFDKELSNVLLKTETSFTCKPQLNTK